MATDADTRGRLLSSFYELRHNAGGRVPTSEMNLAGIESVDRQVIDTICQHLPDADLIEWKPLRGDRGNVIIGMARITGLGVDVIERKTSPGIAVALHDQGRALTGVEAKRIAGDFAAPPMGADATVEVGTLVPDADAAAQIAARQRGLRATVEPLHGTTIPPAVLPSSHGVMMPREQRSNPQPAQSRLQPAAKPSHCHGVIRRRIVARQRAHEKQGG